jgi:hypothetical protein
LPYQPINHKPLVNLQPAATLATLKIFFSFFLVLSLLKVVGGVWMRSAAAA